MTNEREVLTDERIVALNAGERFFSESPSKYPEAGHGTQYHCGLPGLLKFARAVAALSQPSPAVPVAGQSRFSGVAWGQCDIEHVAMVLAAPDEWKGYEVRYLYAAPQPTEQPATQAEAERAMARRLLWLAFVWNDHNFGAAHDEARKEAARHGITNWDEANAWLAAPTTEQPGDALTAYQESRIAEFAKLKQGWDSGDGEPLDPRSLAMLRNIGRCLESSEASIFMTHDGEMAMSWQLPGGSAELVFLPDAAHGKGGA